MPHKCIGGLFELRNVVEKFETMTFLISNSFEKAFKSNLFIIFHLTVFNNSFYLLPQVSVETFGIQM